MQKSELDFILCTLRATDRSLGFGIIFVDILEPTALLDFVLCTLRATDRPNNRVKSAR